LGRRVTHLIALGGSAPADASPLGAAKIVSIAAHRGPLTQVAAVVLPATSWAEHSGTYVNAKGMRQLADKALEPVGSSKPAWKQVADVATALGFEPSWIKLKHIRGRLVGSGSTDAPAAAGASGTASAE
jgi:NADH dehydrogenase/NADH:ubiquinone oxidoreductase subunit G